MKTTLLAIITLIALSGCSHKLSVLERSGMTPEQVEAFNTVSIKGDKKDAAQDGVIAGLLKSVGEIREKLGMNEEKK